MNNPHSSRMKFINYWNHSPLPIINVFFFFFIYCLGNCWFFDWVDIDMFVCLWDLLYWGSAWRRGILWWYLERSYFCSVLGSFNYLDLVSVCYVVFIGVPLDYSVLYGTKSVFCMFFSENNRLVYIFKPFRLAMILSVIPGFLAPIFGSFYFGFQFFHFLRIYESLNFFRSRDFGFKRYVGTN